MVAHSRRSFIASAAAGVAGISVSHAATPVPPNSVSEFKHSH